MAIKKKKNHVNRSHNIIFFALFRLMELIKTFYIGDIYLHAINATSDDKNTSKFG